MPLAARRALIAFLLPALLLAQAIGLVHATVHGGLPAAQAIAAPQAALPQARGWVADLFAAHGDASSCRLFDQLSHGDAAPAAATVAASMPVPCTVGTVVLPVVASATVAAFRARGPPPLR